jgi:CO/xanthine dehydrogenase Mo-binding subunit
MATASSTYPYGMHTAVVEIDCDSGAVLVRHALGLRDGVGALPLTPERVAGLAQRPPRP